MLSTINSFIRIIIMDKASLRFAVGIVIGFAFSISVILATVGIMDGFEWSLKLGLKRSMGDLNVYHRDGTFNFDNEVLPQLQDIPQSKMSAVLKTEAFVVQEELSKGVAVKGVEPLSFSKVSGLTLSIGTQEVAIGKELARRLKVTVGDELVLALPKGNSELDDLPALEGFKIGQIVDHGIYQKDMRFVYMHQVSLQKLLDLAGLSNSFIMSSINEEEINYIQNPEQYIEGIKKTVEVVEEKLGEGFYAKAFWEEFSFLLRAVSTEKYMIGMILQLVVVISIFNVLAFIIFINERRARELFLFQALGMSPSKIFVNMMFLVFFSWLFACLLSLGFVEFFDFLLKNVPLFKLPGDIYTLGSVSINLETIDYIVVFVIALFWVYLMSYIGLARLRKKSILQGLRREFA